MVQSRGKGTVDSRTARRCSTDFLKIIHNHDDGVSEHQDTAAGLEEKLRSYLDGLETAETDANGRIEYENESAVMERLEDLGYK